MKKLAVQQFIEQHSSDWEKLLSEKPYCVSAVRAKWNSRNLVLLKYDQIETDWAKAGQLARECRGLILDEDTLEPVSVPFFKFFNSHEPYADRIDWNDHPYVLEKLDGSIIKVVKLDGKLLVSTNGMPLASEAHIPENIGFEPKTFEDLFYWTLDRQFPGFEICWFENLLDEGYTYMFELCTNYNRVVVPHPEPKAYFIGIRNNTTFEETYIMDHALSHVFPTPRVYKFGSFDECIETAKALSWDSEGYVITGRDFKRNKAKSLGYLSAAHLCNNHVMSYARAVELVRMNEVDEVLAYFPEFETALLEVKDRYWRKIAEIGDATAKLNGFIASNGWNDRKYLVEPGGSDRKKLAVWIMKNFPVPGLAFGLVDGKIESVEKWAAEITAEKMVQMLGFKQPKES